jgi:hypothetical protein
MIAAVIGSRNFTDYKLLESTLLLFPEINQIISGGAKGADSLAKIYAEKNNIPLLIFKPDWKQYGKGAGIVRNRQIIDAAQMVVAFWDGASKGTESSINLAKTKGILLHIVSVASE